MSRSILTEGYSIDVSYIYRYGWFRGFGFRVVIISCSMGVRESDSCIKSALVPIYTSPCGGLKPNPKPETPKPKDVQWYRIYVC